MCPNHHVAYDRGHFYPLRIEDGINQICGVICETTLISRRKNAVGEDMVDHFNNRSIVLV